MDADVLTPDEDSFLASPSGRSRYGRRQKTRLSGDFYNIDTTLAKAVSKRVIDNSTLPRAGKILPYP